MSSSPTHIVMIVTDSLRHDIVFNPAGPSLDYVSQHADVYTNMWSAGCWTLPATATLFTGKLPHEHGATSQTRALRPDVQTLAEHYSSQGYHTVQITSNVATTEIFGLDKGFDEVYKSWNLKPSSHSTLFKFLMQMGKHRVRRRALSKDLITKSFSQDLDAGNVWLEQYYTTSFNLASQILEKQSTKQKKTFLFINLMETHFPYHISHVFELLNKGPKAKAEELIGLYHLVNQTFLKSQNKKISQKLLSDFKKRQELAWKLLAPGLDSFIQSIHQDQDTAVLLCSDHGENFGDEGWSYHFSNVTTACTKIPLFVLNRGQESSNVIDTQLSSRGLFDGLIQLNTANKVVVSDEKLPISESYWYNNANKTLKEYQYNQICLRLDSTILIQRNSQWFIKEKEDLVNIDGRMVENILKASGREEAIKTVVERYGTFEKKLR